MAGHFRRAPGTPMRSAPTATAPHVLIAARPNNVMSSASAGSHTGLAHHQVGAGHVGDAQPVGLHPLLLGQLAAARAHQPQRARLPWAKRGPRAVSHTAGQHEGRGAGEQAWKICGPTARAQPLRPPPAPPTPAPLLTCSTAMMMEAPPGVLNAARRSLSCGAISALYQLAKLMKVETWGKPSPMALGRWSMGMGGAGDGGRP